MTTLYYRRKPSYIFKPGRLLYRGILLVLFTIVALLFARPAHAQEVVFTEDFSSGFAQWQPTRDEGEYWSIHEEALHGVVPQGFTISELVPSDDVWDPSWHNIIYELDLTPLAGVDRNISFHFENLTNWYELHINQGGMEVLRLRESYVPWKSSVPVFLENNVTYRFKLILDEGLIQIYIDDLLVFSEVDPTFTTNYGKIGLKVGTGSIAPTHVVIDNISVSLISEEDPNRLGITRVSQLDERWSNQEYDTAHEWHPENPSIGAWGCALSSMVMILDHYGISTFADSVEITPESLNAWLLAQDDGYIGTGLLNWLAVTRLTGELTDVFDTPSLEISIVRENIIDTLQTEITTHSRPAIVNIPGHFLVAEGVVPDSNPTDFYIQDPSYTYQTLSQHDDEPLSLRLFTPSHTDLSYLLFVKKHGDVQLSVSRDTENIPLLEISESLKDQPSTHLYYVQKPDSGDYQIDIEGNLGSEYEYELLTYNVEGVVTTHTLSGIIGPNPDEFVVTFDKTADTSSLSSQYSVTHLQQDIADLLQHGALSSHFVWYELDRFATLLATYTSPEIQTDLFAFLDDYSTDITPAADAYLRAKISLL